MRKYVANCLAVGVSQTITSKLAATCLNHLEMIDGERTSINLIINQLIDDCSQPKFRTNKNEFFCCVALNGRTRLPAVGISFDAGVRSIVFQLGNSHPIFAPNHAALKIRPLALSCLSLDDNEGPAQCRLEEVRSC